VKVLFVCSRNRLRSPTAERVFADEPGIETDSAGTADDAETPVSLEQIEWADLVVCMERRHASALRGKFGNRIRARLVVLGIPDDYGFMDPELVGILRRRAGAHLGRRRTQDAG